MYLSLIYELNLSLISSTDRESIFVGNEGEKLWMLFRDAVLEAVNPFPLRLK